MKQGNPGIPGRLVLVLALLLGGTWIGGLAAAGDALPRLLPAALETELALSAAPSKLRSGAGVWLLERGGYREYRKPVNHFSCFVVRTVPELDVQSSHALIPICFDEEGMRAVAPVHFDTAKLREQELPPAQLRERIQEGFRSGRYRAPERTGMSFMISPVLNIPDGKGGVWNYPPHFMFYAPHLTNAEQDSTPDHSHHFLPWVNDEGPHGMIIVPVGEAEREALRRDSAELIRKVNDFLRAG